MADTLTPEQLQILQHTLGVDKYGQGEQYRNHFCAGGADVAICEALVAQGFMERYPDRSFIPYPTFGVTDEGKRVMLGSSPKPPKLTRSQKRYQQFLDADSGLTFGEWLRGAA